MATYIEDHPNLLSRQFTAPRRAEPSGAIVVHTAETSSDLTLPDGGAEAVASWISRRPDAGSYHTVVDSDSIVPVVPYGWEAWHEGTGGNRWSLGLSFATRAASWPSLPRSWVEPALRNGAAEAARMARWVQSRRGVVTPARRITAAQYRSLAPGFIGHGELDPGRRTDPGLDFPWDEFLTYYGEAIAPRHTPTEEIEVSEMFHQAMADVRELYLAYEGPAEPDTGYVSKAELLGGQAPATVEDRERNLGIWGRDLAYKMFHLGETPGPTLRFIELHLRGEFQGR